MDRRTLLKSLGLGLGPILLPIAGRGWAAATGGTGPRLVVVMLRGAVDGLNVVVPYAEDNYYRLRGSITIPRPGADGGALDLDGHFGLHPALETMLPLWQSRKLAFVQASGSPDPTRSHFDAQDYMESGTPGDKNTADGWMNRLLAQLGSTPQSADASLDAVSLGPLLPRIFTGGQAVANVPLGRDAAKPTAMDNAQINAAYDRMYAGADAGALGQAYREGRASRSRILSDLSADPNTTETMQADNGAPPPQGFSLDASQLATLMRRNPSLRLAFMQLGGWDTHVNQGGASGQLANHLRPLAEGLSTLATQLGSDFDDTVVVVMSEFGRTARQNGTNGTDHGHGNVIWVLGGPVHGGKVYGDWPGVDDSALHEGRDLAVTTDFRAVLAQVCARHLRLRDAQLAAVFPKAPAHGARTPANLL